MRFFVNFLEKKIMNFLNFIIIFARILYENAKYEEWRI